MRVFFRGFRWVSFFTGLLSHPDRQLVQAEDILVINGLRAFADHTDSGIFHRVIRVEDLSLFYPS